MSLFLNCLSTTPPSAFPKPSGLSLPLPPRNNIPKRHVLRMNNHTKMNKVKAFFFNPAHDPIIQDALKEPVAFMGGVFTGLLRFSLNEEPLKGWVTRTVGSSGITEDEMFSEWLKPEGEAPNQIQIE